MTELEGLALAVLAEAVRDSESRHLPATVRRGARSFLAVGPMLEFWAPAAGLEPGLIIAWARRRQVT